MTLVPKNDAGEPLERLDEALRFLSTAAPPEGLAERVKERLRTAAESRSVAAWPRQPAQGGWMQSAFLRAAAAASIVCAVAGGGWGIYQRVQPVAGARVVVPERNGSGGSFTPAGAVRKPDTLDPPVVPPATQAKPGAGTSRPAGTKTDKPATKPGTGKHAKAAEAPR